MVRVQDKGSRIEFEDKERYINNVLSYLENTDVFQENINDPSKNYQDKVKRWTDKWKGELSENEVSWINKDNVRPGKVYGNIKTHKQSNPYRYIISSNGTSIENQANRNDTTNS